MILWKWPNYLNRSWRGICETNCVPSYRVEVFQPRVRSRNLCLQECRCSVVEGRIFPFLSFRPHYRAVRCSGLWSIPCESKQIVMAEDFQMLLVQRSEDVVRSSGTHFNSGESRASCCRRSEASLFETGKPLLASRIAGSIKLQKPSWPPNSRCPTPRPRRKPGTPIWKISLIH